MTKLLKLLLWAAMTSSATSEILTVTGVSPLSLTNAIAHELVSLTQTGKCVESSGKVYCNNGEIKCSPNLLDASAGNVSLGYYVEKNTGEVRRANGDSNFMCNAYIPVVGGQTYVCYGRTREGGVLSSYNRIAWYDSNQEWISGGNYTQNTVTVNTAPSNAAYARFSCNPSGTTTVPVTQDLVDSYYWVFQKGNTEPSVVHPYGEVWVDGAAEVITLGEQTASVVNLFAADGVADTQEIVSGVVTRRVSVNGDDGVLTMSALAEPYTEHVTPQSMSTVEGTNTLTVTAEVSGIQLEAKYKGVSA